MDFMLPVSQVYLLKYIEYDAQLLEDNIIRAAIYATGMLNPITYVKVSPAAAY